MLFRYDPATQERAARELDDMKARGIYPETRQLIDDYGTTRDTIRACGAK